MRRLANEELLLTTDDSGVCVESSVCFGRRCKERASEESEGGKAGGVWPKELWGGDLILEPAASQQQQSSGTKVA